MILFNQEEARQSGHCGEVKLFTCPGMIININGVFHFLTAGHTLQDWDNALRNEQIIIHSSG